MSKGYKVWLVIFLLNVFSALYNAFILVTGITTDPGLSLGATLFSTIISAVLWETRPKRKVER